jgi:hypothetical protein
VRIEPSALTMASTSQPYAAVLPGQQQQQQQAPAYSRAPPPQQHHQQQRHYQRQQQQHGSLSRIQSCGVLRNSSDISSSSSSSSSKQQMLPPHSGPFFPASCLIKPGKHPPPNVKARLEDQPLMTRTPDERRRVGVSGTARPWPRFEKRGFTSKCEPGKTEFTQYRKGMYIHIR